MSAISGARGSPRSAACPRCPADRPRCALPRARSASAAPPAAPLNLPAVPGDGPPLTTCSDCAQCSGPPGCSSAAAPLRGDAMPAGNPNVALLASALLGLLMGMPARGVTMADTQAFIDCAASTTCTSLCAAVARAAPKPTRPGRRPARSAVPLPRLDRAVVSSVGLVSPLPPRPVPRTHAAGRWPSQGSRGPSRPRSPPT